jgi:hypothetical protein
MRIKVTTATVKKMVEVEEKEKTFILTLSEEEAAALRQLWGKANHLPKDLNFLADLDIEDFRHLDGVYPSWRIKFEKR